MQAISKSLLNESVLDNYQEFMTQKAIQEFIANNGQVHIATERRPLPLIKDLYQLGHRHFSEKFVQETERKWTKDLCGEVILHGYGHLQRNKARRACNLFSVIESIDRDALVFKFCELMREGRSIPEVAIQINIGDEPQKGGYSCKEADSAIDRALNLGIDVIGVMAIPPRGENPIQHYRWLRRLADRHGLKDCFMGMSDDFETAIEEGATAIRIGRAIFGEKHHG